MKFVSVPNVSAVLQINEKETILCDQVDHRHEKSLRHVTPLMELWYQISLLPCKLLKLKDVKLIYIAVLVLVIIIEVWKFDAVKPKYRKNNFS